MKRFKARVVVVVGSLLSVVGCITTVNPVAFTRDLGAPTLGARADNCAVDIVEDGTAFKSPHRILGHLVLEWTATQVKEQGADYALKTLRSAACEQGGHAVINMRALPRGFNEGIIYEGDVVALLDEKGEPLQGKATGTSHSHGGTVPDAGTTPTP